MAEVVIHHISHGGTVLTLAVHYHPQQFAGALLLIAVEHLQGEEVVGRRADVCVEYDERHARIGTLLSRWVIFVRTRYLYTCTAGD